MNKFDIYEMVTNLIIDRLEAGVVPWQMPWKAGSLPRNMVSKKAYRGFNFWYLLSFNFQRPYFLTFHQIKNLGGSVKKGAKSVQVIFWKLNEYEDRDSGEQKKIPMLRYYRVFNIDDTEGIPANKIPDSETHDHDFSPIEACENILSNWQDIPKIESGKSQACYFPLLDTVHMPDPRTFFKDEGYYSTLFHELTHSTGHRKRTDRHSLFPNHTFGSKDYSQEELVAEMGAAYLCGITGIENTTIDNSAAYIDSWLSKLKSDKKFIVQASTHAQAAVDYILQNQSVPGSPELVEAEESLVFEF